MTLFQCDLLSCNYIKIFSTPYDLRACLHQDLAKLNVQLFNTQDSPPYSQNTGNIILLSRTQEIIELENQVLFSVMSQDTWKSVRIHFISITCCRFNAYTFITCLVANHLSVTPPTSWFCYLSCSQEIRLRIHNLNQ